MLLQEAIQKISKNKLNCYVFRLIFIERRNEGRGRGKLDLFLAFFVFY